MMKGRWLYHFCCLTLLNALSFAQQESVLVRTVKVEGNSHFSAREILTWISTTPQSRFSQSQLQRDIEAIVKQYQENGFYFATVDSTRIMMMGDGTTVDLVFYVSEGESVEVGKIYLQGNKALTESEIFSHLETREGVILNSSLLENDIELLLQRYENAGHPFAKVSLDSVVVFEHDGVKKLGIFLRIDEGELISINEIKIEGNKETNENVILRELRFQPGEIYNREKVNGMKQKLQRLNFFSSVSDPELYLTKKGGGLLIKVQEGNTNSFDGILGYVPSSGTNERGFFTGFVNVLMRNLFGTGRRLGVRWQKENTSTQELELRYMEPWLLSFPVNLNVGFLQRQQDSSYVRRAFELKTDILVSDRFSIAVVFGQERVIPSSTRSSFIVFDAKTTSAGLEIHYDTRDDIYNSTSGINYRTDYQLGEKTISSSSSTNVLPGAQSFTVRKYTVDLEAFFQPLQHQVIGIALHGKDLRSDKIEDGDMFRLGGTNSLRGYRENQFVGSRVVWSNLEYRFLLARRSSVYGFFDTGYFFRPADEQRKIPELQAFKTGYGIGFRVDTALGMVGVSYALGQGDTFNTGKIHFGIINQF